MVDKSSAALRLDEGGGAAVAVLDPAEAKLQQHIAESFHLVDKVVGVAQARGHTTTLYEVILIAVLVKLDELAGTAKR